MKDCPFALKRLKTTTLIMGGLLLVAPFGASPLFAADLGGDCCADLEERVAVLEATSARKGNRKLSLEIYGQVNHALLIWDDGRNSDAYVVDNDSRSTRFGFKGKAKINSNWEAGYKIEIQLESASSVSVDQSTDDASNIGLRKSYFYLKNNDYGSLSLGLNSVATDDLTHYGFGLGDYVKPDLKYISSFDVLDSAGNPVLLEWGQLCGAAMSDGDACFDVGSRRDGIRYDSPSIAGFKLSAAWGEDDFWDVALRYAGEFGDFKVTGAIGYAEWDSNNTGGGEEPRADSEESVVASATITHNPTGLFLYGSYRHVEVEDPGITRESDNYFVQGGIKQKWNSLGATAIWGEYAFSDDGLLTSEARNNLFGGNLATRSEYERWGVGLSQWIDAANLQLYVLYQHHEAEINTAVGSVGNLEDFDLGVVGGVIKF